MVPTMTWEEYSEFVRSINLTELADSGYDCIHHSLSLCSEAGEVAGKVVKREFRGYKGAAKSYTDEGLIAELGDCIYHMAALCNNLGVNIQDVWTANAEKLQRRVNKGTLVGEGDER